MAQATHPSKEAIREHMQRRAQTNEPPPSPEGIREQLGWYLIPANAGSTESLPDYP